MKPGYTAKACPPKGGKKSKKGTHNDDYGMGTLTKRRNIFSGLVLNPTPVEEDYLSKGGSVEVTRRVRAMHEAQDVKIGRPKSTRRKRK